MMMVKSQLRCQPLWEAPPPPRGASPGSPAPARFLQDRPHRPRRRLPLPGSHPSPHWLQNSKAGAFPSDQGITQELRATKGIRLKRPVECVLTHTRSLVSTRHNQDMERCPHATAAKQVPRVCTRGLHVSVA